ncbi:MAG TPA: GDSL-type esterase/lipase family protein [Nannocystaceae bacterium]|nr:GDSL-type esterase/lipase family protein [Nannocystaceae bacterium]
MRRWNRLFAIVLVATACGTIDAAEEAPPVPGAAVGASAAARAEVEIALVPILDREVLSARVLAQRKALGTDEPLFEDENGKPVPWIAPQGGTRREPSIDDALLDSLEGSSGLGGAKPIVGERVPGNGLGLYEKIASADGRPLARFHAALHELAAGRDPDGKVRVAIYGASHTEADVYPQYVRSYLQERFGDGGHGFVQVAKPWNGYSHVDVAVDGLDRWRTDTAHRGRGDGYYGLLGASVATSHPKAFARVRPAADVVASRYELHFLAQPRGGSFAVYVDGRRHAEVSTASERIGAGYHAFEIEEGSHAIELQPNGDGEVRLFGITMERASPGVVVDTLGIRGTRAAGALAWDETIWADNLGRRAPDLVVLAFGTNEATDTHQPIADYEERLHAVIERIARAAPQASCLLVGPGDFPDVSDGGTVLPRPRVTEIIAVQQRVAAAAGCGFWDLRAFMGGELAMVKWVAADPPMAAADYVHLTRRGYVRMGMALVDAMMTDFDRSDPLRGR